MISTEEYARKHPENDRSGKPIATLLREHTEAKLGHAGWLNTRLHAVGDNWVELALDWREDLVGDPETGVLASGPIIALMDSACGSALWVARNKATRQVTIDLRVDYMRPALPGSTIIARAEAYKITRQVAFLRGIGYESDPADPICQVAASFMYFDGTDA